MAEWPFGKGEYYCKVCYKDYVKPAIEKYKTALARKDEIEIFPKTYKGKILQDFLPEGREFETKTSDKKDLVEDSLKITAAFYEYDAVVNVNMIKGTESTSGTSRDGTYT